MKSRVKTESITLRIDPRFRFALELLGRKTGATMTSLIERSIVQQATVLRIGGLDWSELWHPEESVRSLRVAAIPDLMPTHEEERRASFCRLWHPFFYRSLKDEEIHEPRLVCLWPSIEELLSHFEDTRSKDFFSVGRKMRAMLQKAGLDAPSDAEMKEAGK